MHVCHCVNACKGCGRCCQSGHAADCPLKMDSVGWSIRTWTSSGSA